MKKFLIYLLVVLVLAGVFFGGAVFGERTQRDLLLDDYSSEEEEITSSAEEDEPLTINDRVLKEMLEDNFNDGGKYDYATYIDCFKHINVRPDGYGIAVAYGGAGAGSEGEYWFSTVNGGKTWSFIEERYYYRENHSFVYLDDVVIRTSGCSAEIFSDHGRKLSKEVLFTDVAGLSDEDGNATPSVVSVNTKKNTVIYGFGSKGEPGQIKANEYTYIAEFDKDLNIVKEIYKE